MNVDVVADADSSSERACGACGGAIVPLTLKERGVLRFRYDGAEVCLDCASRVDRDVHDRIAEMMRSAFAAPSLNEWLRRTGAGAC